jgi:hypothetical protein
MSISANEAIQTLVGLMGPATDEKTLWRNYKASYLDHLADMDQEALLRVVTCRHAFEAEFPRLNPEIPDAVKTLDDFWESTLRFAEMDPEERKRILKCMAKAIRNLGNEPQ